ncbi:hypothetical protein BH10BDE1_BH10BDE1_27960 [soil metagenome]
MRFYPNAKLASAHRKLLELASGGYIRSLASSTGSGSVWTLTDQGFKVVCETVGDLSQCGYKSEAIGHDLLCMAAMLGEWVHCEPEGVEFFTEQELRRLDHSDYPIWVPQSSAHRSDGFWKLPRLPPNTCVALEIERSQKALKKYELVADFYEEFAFVKQVIWITPVTKSSNSIATHIGHYLEQPTNKHSFISLDDFTKLGWLARFRIGKSTGRTLSEFMIALSSPCHRQGDSRLLLETRKKPLILAPENISAAHSFFN